MEFHAGLLGRLSMPSMEDSFGGGPPTRHRQNLPSMVPYRLFAIPEQEGLDGIEPRSDRNV